MKGIVEGKTMSVSESLLMDDSKLELGLMGTKIQCCANDRVRSWIQMIS
jgi:hypothetical protein